MIDISALRDRPQGGSMTVTELNNYIKNLLDSNRALSSVTVSGEISNFTDHRSGHLYFSLKDSTAQIKAVMFRSARERLKFRPEEGMKVTVHGSVSLYSQGGSVQLYANTMTPDGIGALYKAYEQLKARLADEGLFDEENKKLIPRYPHRIGVITSSSGAAVRDIINVTSRRYPLADIYLYPSLVQGDGAEENLIKALDYIDRSGLVDVIIICRGGGSIEDLWAFNSEKLARRIFSANVPIISAVGHETDFTICDFVSDLRAPKPSAAAELSVPDVRDILLMLDSATDRLESSLVRLIENKRERLSRLYEKDIFADPEALFADKRSDLSDLFVRAETAVTDKITTLSSTLKVASARANALSPLAVLSRGYSVARGESGTVRRVEDVKCGDRVSLRVQNGEILTTVDSVKADKE